MADEQKNRAEQSVDALSAMAEGYDPAAKDEDTMNADPSADTRVGLDDAPEGEGQAEVDDGTFAFADDPDAGEAEDAMASLAAGPPSAAPNRKARTAAYNRNQQQANAHNFKKTMIPPLLLVGGLLILFSLITTIMLIKAGVAAEGTTPTRLQAFGPWLIGFSLPMGALLLVGAYLFHADVKRRG